MTEQHGLISTLDDSRVGCNCTLAMKITEFRVPVPLSVDEFKKGEIYMVAIATLDNLNGE